MTSDLVVLGSVNLDIVAEVAALPRPGETVTARRVRQSLGGKGANQAVAAHLLGATVRLLARVGDDPDSAWLRERLAATGLDVTAVRTVAGQRAGRASITVCAAGENTIVVHPGANHTWPDELGEDAAALADAGVLVLQQEVPEAVNLRAAAATDARVVLNAAPSRPVPTALLGRCDPLVVNARELGDQARPGATAELGNTAKLGNTAALTDTAELMDAAEPMDLMAALLERGARAVVTTLGPDGAAWMSASGSGPAASGRVGAPAVRTVDTTGAGDCFVGALATALAGGAALPEAVRWGVVAASASVRVAGTTESYPDAAELRRLSG